MGGDRMLEALDEGKISEWYKLAKTTARKYVPRTDVEDVVQEIILALLRQHCKADVNMLLAGVIARRVIYAYWNRHRRRRIGDRCYQPILFFVRPAAVRLTNGVAAIVPLSQDSAEIAVVDVNLDLVEDKETAAKFLEMVPPRLIPLVERWLDPNRREALNAQQRQALHRLWRRLREQAG